MNRPRRDRGQPSYGYDPRVMGVRGGEPRPPPDYDDPYLSQPLPAPPPFELQSHHAGPYNEPHHPQQYPMNYRDHRLPSAYRATMREPPAATFQPSSAGLYRILCITNINPKVADITVKEALTSDFDRFGDISVSICHDSGERLAYIYFRTYEEAREARHAKARTMLFDRPIEIEPIFEPARTSPVMDPPSPGPMSPGYQSSRRGRSITPPEFYGSNVLPPQPLVASHRRVPPAPPLMPPHHHREVSPPPHMGGYPHQGSRHPTGPLNGPPMAPAPPMPYGRYYMQPSHVGGPMSPYSSPPHEPHPYRSYHHPIAHQSPPYPTPHPAGYPPPPMYGGPPRERERVDNLIRSPRHETYYPPPMEHRGYPTQPSSNHHHSSSRTPASIHSSSSHHHPNSSPNMAHHHATSASSSVRRSPPHPDNAPPVRYLSREFRREKYGSENYNHNEPEEGRPSRVLFINNLDSSKTEDELREIYNPFGTIEEIEIKKITADVASALIKFSSMDCAYKAKTATNGKYLGSLKCRVSYGKVSASRRLWIGGFGPTTTMACLEDEFGKFGNIISLDYISGRPYAYIEYESANQAQFATHHLKGTFVAEAERRIRIEYVDPVERNVPTKLDPSAQRSDAKSLNTNESWNSNSELINDTTSPQVSRVKRSLSPETVELDISAKRAPQSLLPGSGTFPNARFNNTTSTAPKVPSSSLTSSPTEEKSTASASSDKNELNNNKDKSDVVVQHNTDFNNYDVEKEKAEKTVASAQKVVLLPAQNVSSDADSILGLSGLVHCNSIRDIADCCSISWFGQLVLRNFNFPSKMYMCSGRKATIEKYLARLNGASNGDLCPVLKITQRWRLHPQPKLEEVKRRMQSGNLGMLIITSRPEQSPPTDPSSPTCKTPHSSASQQGCGAKQNGDNNEGTESTSIDSEMQANKTTASNDVVTNNEATIQSTQSRPLKNLISYLEQKDAAGVISLSAQESSDQSDGSKLLYAFPPGDFAYNLLKRKAPNLTEGLAREEFLLGVIVGGTETKI